jgi:son of sevenless-like protein
VFFRALYDYIPEADDVVCIAFKKGDIVRVINKLQSGWWDACVPGQPRPGQKKRGWIPSNYFEIMETIS